MDHRLYFVLGDLLANTLVGAIVGWFCWLLVGTGSNMFLTMMLMMAVGMVLALVLWVPFGILFGAMEVMLPLMMTGMVSGMVVGMWIAMSPLGALPAFLIGGVFGFMTITGIWVVNNQLRGVQRFDAQGGVSRG